MFHDLETLGSIHQVHNWEYADATARAAASGFAATDAGKIALQLDDMSLWILADITPTWEPVSKAGAATAVTAAAVLANNALAIGQGGARGVQSVPGLTTDGVSKVTLGEAGVSEGGVKFANATSGTVEIKPPAGALGTSVLTTPIGTGTLLASGASKAETIQSAEFAADAGASDAYAIALTPAVTAYTTGVKYRFKANTANTGAATLNINSVGAQAIKKVAGGVTTDLDTNDIRAGQWVEVVWDGTNFQMSSQLGNTPGATGPTTATTTSTGTQNDFNFSNADRLFVNAGSTLTLNGLVAGVDGQALDVLVKGAAACYLVNEAGGSTAANRILTRFQSPMIIASGGSARLVYDGTAARWVVSDWSSGVPSGPINYTELKRSTDQTAPTATATFASFTTEVSNSWGVFSSGSPTRLTVPTGQGGLWMFSIHWFLNQALTGQIQLGARINGSTFVYAEDMYMSGSTAQKVSTWTLNLAAGDYVEFYYYQASGSDKTFQVQTFNCFRLA
jgi:hypothetical protein